MSNLSNPFSTGGGGPTFESRVQTAFLVTMCVRGQFPALPKGRVEFLKLQARVDGYHTDDFVLSLQAHDGASRKFLTQIKHDIKITSTNATFKEVIANFWTDFNNPELFDQNGDCLALITGPLPATTLNHLRPILNWAKFCKDSTEFIRKVSTPAFSSKEKLDKLNAIRSILDEVNGTAITDDQLWRFCSAFKIYGYDFDWSTGKDWAQIISMIELSRNQSSGQPSEDIWNRLIAYIQDANQSAATITYENLPAEMTDLFIKGSCITESDSIQRLKEHGSLIIGNIDNTIDTVLSIDRSREVEQLLTLLDDQDAVLITGIAGIGKSAVVKNLVSALPNDAPVFIFKAEEFNHPHIHQFFSSIGIHENLDTLSARFALLPAKYIIIDGLEKLLELSHRDAFLQFLKLIRQNGSWKIIGTCRVQAVELIRQEFLIPNRISATAYEIPPLNERDLALLANAKPGIQRLLTNRRIRNFLTVPYHLKLACKIDWSKENVNSFDELNFKRAIWSNVIEKAPESAHGLPHKRRDCFIDIALRRAKRMAISVPRESCDSEALNRLVSENVLVEIQVAGVMGYAPSHDLLEDWALMNYIGEVFLRLNNSPEEFFKAIGEEPAMRRSFRLWLKESLDGPDNTLINSFLISAFDNAAIEQYWRDEIGIAILLSDSSVGFFAQQREALLKDDAALLTRLMHLLRTACKIPDEDFIRQMGVNNPKGIDALGYTILKPVGSGWPTMIAFINDNIEQLNLGQLDLILGILQDWTGKYKDSAVFSDTLKHAGLIALNFWTRIKDSYRHDENKRELLKVFFSASRVLKSEVRNFIKEALADEDAHSSDDIFEVVLDSLESYDLCRYLPELVSEVAIARWPIPHTARVEYHSLNMHELFYLRPRTLHDYFPASALQTPIHFLFRFAPDIALDLVLQLVNHSTIGYTNSRLDGGRGQIPQVTIHLNDGSTIKQWSSARLWELYRSTHVGPDLLESALMALEAWLVGIAERGEDLGEVFHKLLTESNSVATTSVLVGVATAYPFKMGEFVLPLLRTRELYRWDFDRMAKELSHVSDFRSMMGIPSRGMEDLFYNERKESDAKPHRKASMEWLVIQLQTTPLRDSVFEIIDSFHGALPPIEEQTDGDRLWRIALGRMDLRKFTPEADPNNADRIILTPKEMEPDIVHFQESHKPTQERFEKTNSLLMWGMKSFKKETDIPALFQSWREALVAAQEVRKQFTEDDSDSDLGSFAGGPAYIAALCIRDHLRDLDEDQKEWCVNIIGEEVMKGFHSFDHTFAVSRFEFDGSRPSAFVLPLLLDLASDDEERKAVRLLIAASLLHPSDEVRSFARGGIHSFLWEKDPEFANACLNGMIEYARLYEELLPYYRNLYGEEAQANAEYIISKKQELCQKIAFSSPDWNLDETITFDKYAEHKILEALALIPPKSKDEFHARLFSDYLAQLIDEEKRDRIQSEHRFMDMFSQFALHQTAEQAVKLYSPIIECIDKNPDFPASVIKDLIYKEDLIGSGEVFWKIWQVFAEKLFTKKELLASKREAEYGDYGKMVRTLFFADVYWKEDAKEWKPLTERKDFLKTVCDELGHSPVGFASMVKLLNSVGQIFLPEAIIWLADAMRRGDAETILSVINTRYYLEVILRNTVYMRWESFRGNSDLKQAVLFLLDNLVGVGSSIAFQLRERLISPIPSN